MLEIMTLGAINLVLRAVSNVRMLMLDKLSVGPSSRTITPN